RDVLEAAEEPLRAARILALPRGEHGLDLTPLHVVLRAAKLARNDREATAARVARDVALGAISERADDDVAPVVADELRRHRLQARAVEHVQEQRLDDVVAMVAERDLRRTDLARDAIEDPAAQPRAEAAHRLARSD